MSKSVCVSCSSKGKRSVSARESVRFPALPKTAGIQHYQRGQGKSMTSYRIIRIVSAARNPAVTAGFEGLIHRLRLRVADRQRPVRKVGVLLPECPSQDWYLGLDSSRVCYMHGCRIRNCGRGKWRRRRKRCGAGYSNARMPTRSVRKHCALDETGERTPARAHDRILKVAGTVALSPETSTEITGVKGRITRIITCSVHPTPAVGEGA